MDYDVPGGLKTHQNWDEVRALAKGRLVLMTTKGATPMQDFKFQRDDNLVFGAEGSGVPDFVHQSVDARIVIPMAEGARSLNLSNSVAITVFEALRQMRDLP